MSAAPARAALCRPSSICCWRGWSRSPGACFPWLPTRRPTTNHRPAPASARAPEQRGVTALEALYDHFAEGEGGNLIYFPVFNYNEGNLDVVRQMLMHPRALYGLSDGGAHVGTICDASSSTFMLTHWVRDRAEGRLPLEAAVNFLTQRSAAYLGLHDRGRIAPGQRADLNLIDPSTALGRPLVVGARSACGWQALHAKGLGYLGTWVAGQCVQREGELSAARPGRLVRLGQQRQPV